jgi:hypothetical protein
MCLAESPVKASGSGNLDDKKGKEKKGDAKKVKDVHESDSDDDLLVPRMKFLTKDECAAKKRKTPSKNEGPSPSPIKKKPKSPPGSKKTVSAGMLKLKGGRGDGDDERVGEGNKRRMAVNGNDEVVDTMQDGELDGEEKDEREDGSGEEEDEEEEESDDGGSEAPSLEASDQELDEEEEGSSESEDSEDDGANVAPLAARGTPKSVAPKARPQDTRGAYRSVGRSPTKGNTPVPVIGFVTEANKNKALKLQRTGAFEVSEDASVVRDKLERINKNHYVDKLCSIPVQRCTHPGDRPVM